MVAPLSHVYVNMINAFRLDCANLIKKFREKQSEDFKDFSATWRAFKFNFVYEKYTHQGLHHDFKQDTLQIAKAIMLNDYFVGGIFLLYALYYVQDDPKASIRIEYHEFEKLLKLLKEERESVIKTCQPGYIFAKLLKNDAFDFVRFSRDFTMEGQNRARLVFSDQPFLQQEAKEIDKRAWLEDYLKKFDVIDDLKKLDEKYSQMAHKIKEDHPEWNLSIMPEDTTSGMLKHIMDEECNSDNTSASSITSIGTRRRRVKNKALKFKYRYRRPKDVEDSITTNKPKKKGAPKGKRKFYFRTVVNDPDMADEESWESDEDDPKLSVPHI